MSERELEKRQARALLYAMALLHLLCLGLLTDPPDAIQVASQFAARAVSLLGIG